VDLIDLVEQLTLAINSTCGIIIINETIPRSEIMRDLSPILLHPIRSRITQYLAIHKTATAGELASFISDVPRTTLYRHLNVLAEHTVIKVVAENRIRGAVERTYSLDVQSMGEANSLQNTLRNAFGFLMTIYGNWATYFNKPDPDPGKDKLFLSNLNLMLSDAEFDEFIAELNTLLLKHLHNAPDAVRKQRSISIVSSPIMEEIEHESNNK